MATFLEEKTTSCREAARCCLHRGGGHLLAGSDPGLAMRPALVMSSKSDSLGRMVRGVAEAGCARGTLPHPGPSGTHVALPATPWAAGGGMTIGRSSTSTEQPSPRRFQSPIASMGIRGATHCARQASSSGRSTSTALASPTATRRWMPQRTAIPRWGPRPRPESRWQPRRGSSSTTNVSPASHSFPIRGARWPPVASPARMVRSSTAGCFLRR